MKSTTLCLTFDSPDLPDRVNIGYKSYKVKLFAQKTQQCFKCQRYGHHSSNCKGHDRCRKCGKNYKTSDCENGTLKCVNCKGSHASSSKECPWYEKTKQANKVMAAQKMTFREALIYNDNKSRVEKKTEQSISVQTVENHSDKITGYKSEVKSSIKTENLISFICQICRVYEQVDKGDIEQRHGIIVKLCAMYLDLDLSVDKLVENSEIANECFNI